MNRYFPFILLLLIPKVLIADSILVVGDSLSAAYGFDLDKGWVHLLQNKLSSENNDHTSWRVVNASVAGETTTGGLARLPDLLAKYRPELTILALGGNDGLRGQNIKLIRSNLHAMVKLARKFGGVVLLGMKLPPNYGKAYTQAFEKSYEEVARASDIRLVPFFIEGVTEKAALMQADNIHPNEAAQPHIFNNVWPYIETELNLQK